MRLYVLPFADIQDILLEAVEQVLRSAEWQLNLQTFIDTHCYLFIEDSKNGFHHGQYDAFQEFIKLKETIVTSAIAELGCSTEAFLAACESTLKGSNRSKSASTRALIDMLLYMDEFQVRDTRFTAWYLRWSQNGVGTVSLPVACSRKPNDTGETHTHTVIRTSAVKIRVRCRVFPPAAPQVGRCSNVPCGAYWHIR